MTIPPSRDRPPTALWQIKMQHLMDDLQFLIGRPEECAFLMDQIRSIHDRRTCVERAQVQHDHLAIDR
jgi:hypothetical protein